MSTLHSLLLSRAIAASILGLLLAGCDYDVPLSAQPDRPIDEKLIGNWISPDGWMTVRRFDADNYVVFHNGTMYRAWHSTVGTRGFVTVQSLEPDRKKYAYHTYSLTAGGRRLDLRFVGEEVVPKSIKDTAEMRQVVERHAADPKLLSDPVPFTRMK
jgi:hypothetical protein